jgi:hypothetical protein
MGYYHAMSDVILIGPGHYGSNGDLDVGGLIGLFLHEDVRDPQAWHSLRKHALLLAAS